MIARFYGWCGCGCGERIAPGDDMTRTTNRGWCLTEHCAVPRPGREETFLHGLKPEARLGRNPWVTEAMNGEVAAAFGERGVYYEEYRHADLRGPAECPNGHETWFKASVGCYVCPECGALRTKEQVAA